MIPFENQSIFVDSIVTPKKALAHFGNSSNYNNYSNKSNKSKRNDNNTYNNYSNSSNNYNGDNEKQKKKKNHNNNNNNINNHNHNNNLKKDKKKLTVTLSNCYELMNDEEYGGYIENRSIHLISSDSDDHLCVKEVDSEVNRDYDDSGSDNPADECDDNNNLKYHANYVAGDYDDDSISDNGRDHDDDCINITEYHAKDSDNVSNNDIDSGDNVDDCNDDNNIHKYKANDFSRDYDGDSDDVYKYNGYSINIDNSYCNKDSKSNNNVEYHNQSNDNSYNNSIVKMMNEKENNGVDNVNTIERHKIENEIKIVNTSGDHWTNDDNHWSFIDDDDDDNDGDLISFIPIDSTSLPPFNSIKHTSNNNNNNNNNNKNNIINNNDDKINAFSKRSNEDILSEDGIEVIELESQGGNNNNNNNVNVDSNSNYFTRNSDIHSKSFTSYSTCNRTFPTFKKFVHLQNQAKDPQEAEKERQQTIMETPKEILKRFQKEAVLDDSGYNLDGKSKEKSVIIDQRRLRRLELGEEEEELTKTLRSFEKKRKEETERRKLIGCRGKMKQKEVEKKCGKKNLYEKKKGKEIPIVVVDDDDDDDDESNDLISFIDLEKEEEEKRQWGIDQRNQRNFIESIDLRDIIRKEKTVERSEKQNRRKKGDYIREPRQCHSNDFSLHQNGVILTSSPSDDDDDNGARLKLLRGLNKLEQAGDKWNSTSKNEKQREKRSQKPEATSKHQSFSKVNFQPQHEEALESDGDGNVISLNLIKGLNRVEQVGDKLNRSSQKKLKERKEGERRKKKKPEPLRKHQYYSEVNYRPQPEVVLESDDESDVANPNFSKQSKSSDREGRITNANLWETQRKETGYGNRRSERKQVIRMYQLHSVIFSPPQDDETSMSSNDETSMSSNDGDLAIPAIFKESRRAQQKGQRKNMGKREKKREEEKRSKRKEDKRKEEVQRHPNIHISHSPRGSKYDNIGSSLKSSCVNKKEKEKVKRKRKEEWRSENIITPLHQHHANFYSQFQHQIVSTTSESDDDSDAVSYVKYQYRLNATSPSREVMSMSSDDEDLANILKISRRPEQQEERMDTSRRGQNKELIEEERREKKRERREEENKRTGAVNFYQRHLNVCSPPQDETISTSFESYSNTNEVQRKSRQSEPGEDFRSITIKEKDRKTIEEKSRSSEMKATKIHQHHLTGGNSRDSSWLEQEVESRNGNNRGREVLKEKRKKEVLLNQRRSNGFYPPDQCRVIMSLESLDDDDVANPKPSRNLKISHPHRDQVGSGQYNNSNFFTHHRRERERRKQERRDRGAPLRKHYSKQEDLVILSHGQSLGPVADCKKKNWETLAQEWSNDSEYSVSAADSTRVLTITADKLLGRYKRLCKTEECKENNNNAANHMYGQPTTTRDGSLSPPAATTTTEDTHRNSLCYVLELTLDPRCSTFSSKNSCYVGETINFDKRIRQHNRELAGGAVVTTEKILQARQEALVPGHSPCWRPIVRVLGFPTERMRKKFEYRMNHVINENTGKCKQILKKGKDGSYRRKNEIIYKSRTDWGSPLPSLRQLNFVLKGWKKEFPSHQLVLSWSNEENRKRIETFLGNGHFLGLYPSENQNE